MPSFFHDSTPATAADHNPTKRSFNLFGKKKKADPTPLHAPPPPPAKDPTPPPTPKPPVQQQRTPRKLVKKGSSDIDDELRQHFKREGHAFLAFSDPPSHPPQSSRRDGTLNDVDRMDEEAPKTDPKKLAPEVDYTSPARLPMQPIQPTQQAKPGFFAKIKPAAPGKTENVPVSSLPVRGSSMPPQSYSNENVMDRMIPRKTSEKSQSSEKSMPDSGKDMGADIQEQRKPSPVQRSATNSPALPPPGSTAMARLTLESSMLDLDPRLPSPVSNNRRPSRRGPADTKRHSNQGPGYRGSYQGNRLSVNPEIQVPSDDEKRLSDSSNDERRSFTLPVPIMGSPAGYSSTLNELQLTCATAHKQAVMSANIHHRIVCMVCQSDAPSERWSCSYCALRFCTRCKNEFSSGKSFEQVLERAEAEDWRSLPPLPPTAIRSPEKNFSWELACRMEVVGRFGLRAPPPPRSRRSMPPPPRHSPAVSGKSSPDQPSSPSRNSRDSSSYEDEKEAKRKTIDRIMKSGRCSPAVVVGSAADQRRALLGGGLC